jgi:hypothetical protein
VYNTPIIYFHSPKLNRSEHLPSELSFEQLPFENKAVVKSTSKGAVQFGCNIAELQEYIAGVLSLSGMLWSGEVVKSVTLRENKRLELVIRGVSGKTFIDFEELRVFDPELLYGLEIDRVNRWRLLVYDECAVTTKKHDMFMLFSKEDLANKVYFAKHNRLLVESRISKKNIDKFDYSVTAMKYAVKDMIEQAQLEHFVRGLVVTHDKRTVHNQDVIICKPVDGVVYDKRKIGELCKGIQGYISRNIHQEGTRTQSMLQDAYHYQMHQTITDLIG